VGWGPDFQDEIPDAEKPEAGRHGCWEHQEARLAVPPGEDRALAYWAVPPWTKNLPTPQCWWCRHQTQTRVHLLEVSPKWEAQQKILWAEVQRRLGGGRAGGKYGTSWPMRGAAGRY